MTLYRYFGLGKESPFGPTPEERTQGRSRLKTAAVIVSIISGVVAILSGLVMMPDKVGVAAAKAVQSQLDDRYAKKGDCEKEHLRLERLAIDAAASARADASGYADGIKDAVVGELRSYESRTDTRLDKILMHTTETHNIVSGASLPAYEPLPRKK